MAWSAKGGVGPGKGAGSSGKAAIAPEAWRPRKGVIRSIAKRTKGKGRGDIKGMGKGKKGKGLARPRSWRESSVSVASLPGAGGRVNGAKGGTARAKGKGKSMRKGKDGGPYVVSSSAAQGAASGGAASDAFARARGALKGKSRGKGKGVASPGKGKGEGKAMRRTLRRGLGKMAVKSKGRAKGESAGERVGKGNVDGGDRWKGKAKGKGADWSQGKGADRGQSKGADRGPGKGKAKGKEGNAMGQLSAEDRELMKKITIVAQLDKVPDGPPAMHVRKEGGGFHKGGTDAGVLSSRWGANFGR